MNTENIISNTSYLILNQIAIAVFGYVFWMSLGKLLEPDALGKFSIIINTSFLITSITVLGFVFSSIKLISSYITKKRFSYASGTMGWIFKTSMALTIFLTIIVMMFLLIFNNYDISIIIGIFIYTILSSCYLLSDGYLISIQKLKKLFITTTISYFFKIFMSIFLIIIGFDYFGPVVGFSISIIILLILRKDNFLSFTGKFNKKDILKYGRSGAILNIALMLMNSVGVVVLALFSTAYSIGIFTFAYMISQAVKMYSQAVSISILPTASIHNTLEKKHNIIILCEKAIKYSLVLLLPLMVILILFSNDVILLLSSPKYLDSVLPFKLLLFGSFLIGISMIISSILYSSGFSRDSRTFVSIGSIIYVTLSLFFVLFTSVEDQVGVSYAYTISSLFMVMMGFYYLWKNMRIIPRIGDIIKVLFSSMLPATIFFISTDHFIIGREIALLILFAIYFILYLLLLRLTSFFDVHDMKFFLKIERKYPKIISPIIKFLIKIIR